MIRIKQPLKLQRQEQTIIQNERYIKKTWYNNFNNKKWRWCKCYKNTIDDNYADDEEDDTWNLFKKLTHITQWRRRNKSIHQWWQTGPREQ